MDVCKSLNIGNGTVTKNPEMLKFVLIILKLKTCVSMQLKKLPYLFRYVPDQYKTQQICDKAILENGGALKSFPDCYKNQELCNKAVDSYPHTLEFVPECFMTPECGQSS